MTPSIIYRIWQAEVNRWHHSTQHRLRNSQDTIQSHQCRVTQLLANIFPDCTKEDLIEAIFHDVPESWTGDVAYTAKQISTIGDAHTWAETDIARKIGIPSSYNEKIKLVDGIDCILWASTHARDIMNGNGWPEHIANIIIRAQYLNVENIVLDIFKISGINVD